MRKYLIILPVLLLMAVSGCVRTATLTSFETGEVLKGKFTDSAGTGGNVSVTMTDGEVLSGKYSAVRETDHISFSAATMNAYDSYGGSLSASAIGSQRVVGGQGKAYAILSSEKPGSSLVMEIIVIYGVLDGHGFGDAITNDGRAYKVQF